MKTNWGAAFQIAAVYVGTIVGAGFATGREIVEFFTRFGFIGLIGILMSGYIFIALGSKLMRVSAKIGASSYQEFNIFLFGRLFGSIINIMMLVMLLGVCGVMLSGAGAIFSEQLGLSRNFGLLLTLSLSIIVLIVGIKGLFAVNTIVVPLMISFSFILMFISFQLPNFLDQLFFIPYVDDGWKSVVSPFSYTALNLGLAQAVLVPVAAEIKNEDTVKWGGTIGGIALTLILLSSHFTLMMLPNVEAFEIPMAVVMKNLAAGLHGLYILIIYGEIFTSVIGNVFGLERQLKTFFRLPSLVIVGGILAIAFVISQVEYGTLLSYLYPIFGYISIIFIILLWLKPLEQIKKRP
ncbi:YkvI family membrane protein [Robertmurraya massiliosenegalensis]|uniref:YkvI family membrane protein n=1 Tax=Robertmurraya massiliosenegalensis TaxID=1287657 RepID=UPI0002E72D92|nr:membrane protein [Robertmurraya massiliosenegalensis]